MSCNGVDELEVTTGTSQNQNVTTSAMPVRTDVSTLTNWGQI